MNSRRLLLIAGIVVVFLLGGGAAAYYLGTHKQTPSASSSQNHADHQAATKPQDETSGDATAVTKQLQIYYIALEDANEHGTVEPVSGEKVGCGDTLVPVKTEPVTVVSPLKEAMTRLLAADQYYGESGLYNALYQSDLTYKNGHAEGTTVTVELTGTIRQNGECDAPRIKAQLEQTARDATDMATANITVNGQPLADVLSLR